MRILGLHDLHGYDSAVEMGNQKMIRCISRSIESALQSELFCWLDSFKVSSFKVASYSDWLDFDHFSVYATLRGAILHAQEDGCEIDVESCKCGTDIHACMVQWFLG